MRRGWMKGLDVVRYFRCKGDRVVKGACVWEGEGEDKMNRLLRCREILCSVWQHIVPLVRDVMSLDR